MKNITAPRSLKIKGQDHMLAYITAKEAEALKARGGSGRMTKYGVRSYEDGDGNGDGNSGGDANDNSTSNSEASSQDAAGGNAGQGAGPTGAGAGGTGEAGPGNTGGIGGLGSGGMSAEDAEGTATAANMNTSVAAQQLGLAAPETGVTPSGFSPLGISQALAAYDAGLLGIGQLAANIVGNIAAPPGVQLGYSVDELGNKTEAISVSPMGLGLGLAGLATGVPGIGTALGFAGNALGQAMGVGNVIGHASSETMSPDATGGAEQGLLDAVPPVELPSAVGSLQKPRYQIVNNTLVPVPSGLLG